MLSEIQKAKLIKSVTGSKFEIGLYELANGQYVIAHMVTVSERPQLSENITDFKTAAFMFDLKLRELEGH